MLALTRKQGESIQVGDDITVHITRIGDHEVRVAIDAPRSISVMRSELLDKTPLLQKQSS
jgi:carbon storage regulator